MWFIKFWLISSAISCVVGLISLKAIEAEIKRENIKIPKIKTSIYEKIKVFFYFMIPIFNLIMVFIVLLKSDDVKQRTIEKYKKYFESEDK